MHLESQSIYLVEVSKMVGPSRLFAPENVVCVGGVWIVVWIGPSLGVPESRLTFEGIHAIICTVCVSLLKMSGGFLRLHLA